MTLVITKLIVLHQINELQLALCCTNADAFTTTLKKYFVTRKSPALNNIKQRYVRIFRKMYLKLCRNDFFFIVV